MSILGRTGLSARVYSLRDPLVWQRRGLTWLARGLTYLILIEVSYVFLFPVIFMVSTSFKSPQDLADITVYWIPTQIHLAHYEIAFQFLDYVRAAGNSVITSVPTSMVQVVSCSLIAYGFARIQFAGRNILFLLVIFTFIVPPQTVVVPLYFLYLNLDWIDTYMPFWIPPIFGHGVRGALFILIFRQFFRGLPWELEDAAFVDGASRFRVYWQIILPLSAPAMLVVFLFSLVWYWNDSFLSTMFLSNLEALTLPARLLYVLYGIWASFSHYGAVEWSEAVLMASTVMVIAPQVVFYIFVQRHFIHSVDRTGLVE